LKKVTSKTLIKVRNLNPNIELEEQIERYVNGELNQDEVDTLWTQLIREPYYAEYLKTVANVSHIINSSKVHKLETEEIRSTNVWYAFAASVILVIGLMATMLIYQDASVNQFDALANLEMHNVRSSSISADEVEAGIQHGIGLAVTGNTREAISHLSDLHDKVNREDVRSDIRLNIGIIQYNSALYEEARNTFQSITENSSDDKLMMEKALWYQANTYLKLGSVEEARTIIRQVHEIDGAYRRIAATYLSHL
jgi:tetratricopeptide (TPR) repeat protein